MRTEHSPEPARLSDLGRAMLEVVPELAQRYGAVLAALDRLQHSDADLARQGVPDAVEVMAYKAKLQEIAAAGGPEAANAEKLLSRANQSALRIPESEPLWQALEQARKAHERALVVATASLGPFLAPRMRKARELALEWRQRLGLSGDSTPADAWRLREALANRIESIEDSPTNQLFWFPDGANICLRPDQTEQERARNLEWFLACTLLTAPSEDFTWDTLQAHVPTGQPATFVALRNLEEIVYRSLAGAFCEVWRDSVEADRFVLHVAWRQLTGRDLDGRAGCPSLREARRLAGRFPGRIRIDRDVITQPRMSLRGDGVFVITYPGDVWYPGHPRKTRRRTPPRRRRM